MGIGERLREERQRLGLTQPEMGALASVGKQAQLRYEAGERSPDAQYLEAVAARGVDVLYVLTGRRDAGALSPEEQTLIGYYREAAPAVRRAALGALLGAAAGPAAPAAPRSVSIGNMTNQQAGGVQVGFAGGAVSVRSAGVKKHQKKAG